MLFVTVLFSSRVQLLKLCAGMLALCFDKKWKFDIKDWRATISYINSRKFTKEISYPILFKIDNLACVAAVGKHNDASSRINLPILKLYVLKMLLKKLTNTRVIF